MEAYTRLVQHVLDNGTRKENRTGTDTIGVFGYFYKHDLKNGFPLLTTKKMQWHHIVLENLWFMSGSRHADFLRHYNVKFWEPWTDENGIVSNCYGPAWMEFPSSHGTINQISWALKELRNNPLSRRIVISAWNPEDAHTAKLPPCHVTWVLNTQYDKEGDLCLNLALLQRSCDIGLGVPYNLAGYSFLLQLFAHLTNLKVGAFAHTLVDAHIYVDHIDGLKVQISREPRALPSLHIDPTIRELRHFTDLIHEKPSIDYIMSMFRLDGYDPHPAITLKVAV